jgi:hypothetical protein
MARAINEAIDKEMVFRNKALASVHLMRREEDFRSEDFPEVISIPGDGIWITEYVVRSWDMEERFAVAARDDLIPKMVKRNVEQAIEKMKKRRAHRGLPTTEAGA